MNTTSSKNPSSELAGANGPLPASAPQTAKQERISTAVAVSRSPQRSAVHNSGNTAKNASALLTALSSKSGLNATSPTTLVAMMPTIEDNTLSESKEVPAAISAPSMQLGASPTKANFATPAGVLKVLPPCDQRRRR